MIGSAYLAADGFETQLAQELERAGVRVDDWHGRLALSPDPPIASAWALDTWTSPQEVAVASVKAAADALRAVQRNWSAYAAGHHRRMALIGERLPPVKSKPIRFPDPAPTSHLGAWTLLAPDRLLFSPAKSSPVPGGAWQFEEDRTGPPSRAYLKLWEALTRVGVYPGPGQTCLDLGASPGGWSWVLAQLGASVTAVDKAALDPAVAGLPNVTTLQESAFALEPRAVDWLVCDVIAYPARLLGLMTQWIEAAAPGRIVCTVKFQGDTDLAAQDGFAAIPGGALMHLAHNKHELTFVWARR